VLSDADKALLDFEGQWWRSEGAKEAAIREVFDLSATRYYQRVRDIAQRPEAEMYAPRVVRRVNAQRRSVEG
jgi:hypothetical protein